MSYIEKRTANSLDIQLSPSQSVAERMLVSQSLTQYLIKNLSKKVTLSTARHLNEMDNTSV